VKNANPPKAKRLISVLERYGVPSMPSTDVTLDAGARMGPGFDRAIRPILRARQAFEEVASGAPLMCECRPSIRRRFRVRRTKSSRSRAVRSSDIARAKAGSSARSLPLRRASRRLDGSPVLFDSSRRCCTFCRQYVWNVYVVHACMCLPPGGPEYSSSRRAQGLHTPHAGRARSIRHQ
jgi:hypothetical protein